MRHLDMGVLDRLHFTMLKNYNVKNKQKKEEAEIWFSMKYLSEELNLAYPN